MSILSDIESRIASAAHAAALESIDFLREVVDVPSSTLNHAGVREVGRLFRARLDRLGFDTRWIEMPPEMNRAGHLFAERNGVSPRVLLIGHLDTVLEGEPFSRVGDVGFGTGISDMKGGNLVAVLALEALASCGALEGRSITIALMGDEEEAGRPLTISRKELIEAALRSDFALAFECCVPGTGTVGRRGILSWRLEVESETGHSSKIFSPELGSGSILEAARILDAFRQFAEGEPSLTLNPSVFLGGTELEYEPTASGGGATGKTNVIPARAVVAGDLRFLTNDQRDRAVEVMQGIVAQSLPRTSASLTFAEGYPAMAPVEANYDLLRRLDEVSVALGHGALTALDPLQRGAGDVSFVGPLIPSIDGLGAAGDHEHAPGENIDLAEWPRIVQRAALLIHRLTATEWSASSSAS